MDIKAGDELTVTRTSEGGLAISRTEERVRERERARALERIKALSRPLPADYKFDRDEIYDRLGPYSPGRKRYDDD